MTFLKILEQVESDRFAAYLNAASGFNIFRLALENKQELRTLIREMQKHPNYAQSIFQRLSSLLKVNHQPQYAHPHDVALAGYLFALSHINSELTVDAIDQILRTPQLWWSQRLAKFLQAKLSKDEIQIDWMGQTKHMNINSASSDGIVVNVVPITTQPTLRNITQTSVSDTITTSYNYKFENRFFSQDSQSADAYEREI